MLTMVRKVVKIAKKGKQTTYACFYKKSYRFGRWKFTGYKVKNTSFKGRQYRAARSLNSRRAIKRYRR